MQSFECHPGPRLVCGAGSIKQLGALALELGGGPALVVTDPGLIEAGIVQRGLQALAAVGIETVVFDGVAPNPTTEHVEAGLASARRQGPLALIIGLGGGSAMDCAKGINFLLSNGGTMEDYWGFGKATKPMLPSIGVPTTAGTGSEAQSYALIARADNHEKMACGDRKACFGAVVLDGELLASLPRQVAAIAGLDALSHAVESWVTTRRNPVSKVFARAAWDLLDGAFAESLEDGADLQGRSDMLLGAHWAGLAIESSMLGAAHACANPLTARHDIPHGVAVGLMLPAVVEFNSVAVDELYAELYPGGGAALAARLVQLRRIAGLPEQLRACRVSKEELPDLARSAADQWTGGFNPRPVDAAQFLQLYETTF